MLLPWKQIFCDFQYIFNYNKKTYNRLYLTFHGRKGLPVASRIALLDSIFLKYQDACIATIQTTLKAGTVSVTIIQISACLSSPTQCSKSPQVQIVRAPQAQTTNAAILHFKMAYRLQNHAFEILTPNWTDDALLINYDTSPTPQPCVHSESKLSGWTHQTSSWVIDNQVWRAPQLRLAPIGIGHERYKIGCFPLANLRKEIPSLTGDR